MRDMRQRAACGASAASIASDARRHRSLGDVSLAYAFLDATQLATLAARHLVGALSSSFLRCSFLSSDGLFSLTGADPFSGFHRFSPFHFLSLSGKEISAYGRGGIGSSRRLLFQRSSVPPRSPLHYQLENGGLYPYDKAYSSTSVFSVAKLAKARRLCVRNRRSRPLRD